MLAAWLWTNRPGCLPRLNSAKMDVMASPDLEEGVNLALVGWTKLQTCPSVATGDDATSLAEAFIQVGTSDAPEPGAP